MKYLVVLLLAALFAFDPAAAQKLDTVTLDRIGKQLIAAEMRAQDAMYNGKDNCIRDKEGHYLSCFSVSSDTAWVTDFNHDGHPDAVFHLTDEGLGGGGNAFGYDYRVVLLDGSQQIIDQYSIFGGGKFSHTYLSIEKVEDGKIRASCDENQFLRGNYEDTANLQQVLLVFSFEKDKIVEEGYKRCALAAMNRQLFKNDTTLLIRRSYGFDEYYNEEYTEQVTAAGGKTYTASLGGCNDLSLFFNRNFPYTQSLERNKPAIKKAILAELDFLVQHTLFRSALQKVRSQIEKRSQEQIVIEEYGGTGILLSLEDNWKASVHVGGNKEQSSYISIRLTKNVLEEADYWEVMNRKYGK